MKSRHHARRARFKRTASNPCEIQAAPRASAGLLPLGAMLCGMALMPLAHAQSSEREATLPEVNVKDSRDAQKGNGYQGGTTNVGKTKQLPKDIPQAITIVPESIILDTNSDTLKSALRNVAGITYNAGEGGRIGDNFNLRGFYTFGDTYLDGIRDVAQYNRETFYTEQVDVLRGSAAMLFGRGQAGGVINQVSKTPGLVDKTRVSGTVGSYQYGRGTVDTNKVIGENAAIRVNAMKTSAESSRDEVKTDREGIMPSISFGIGTKDEFNLSYLYLDTHNTPDYGVPFFQRKPVNTPASRYYGTSSDYEDNVTRIATTTYTHRFSPATEIKSVLRVADYERDLWVSVPRVQNAAALTSVNDSTVITRTRSARGSEEHTITSQTDFTTKFDAMGMKHEALVGLELLRERAGRWSYINSAGSAPNTTLGNPDNSPTLPAGYGGQVRSAINTYYADSWGLYGQDTIEFVPGWKFLAGVRRDHMDADYLNQDTNVTTNLKYQQWSYRSGLMYQPNDVHSYYFAWSSSFNPTADLYQLGNNGPAERSRTIELGAKWELFDGNLSLRSAIYRAIKKNERNTDLEQANVGLLSKERHTDGIEFEGAGRLAQGWEVFGGVSFMRAEIDEYANNPNSANMRPRNTPPYAFNLWTTYRIGGGWRVGGGVEGKGNRTGYGLNGTAPIAANVAPHYTRWDALLGYEGNKYEVRLNVLNLLNKKYYESIYDNGGHVVPGTERAFQVTLDYRF